MTHSLRNKIFIGLLVFMLLVPATSAARSISGEPSVNSSSSPGSDATQSAPLPGPGSIFLPLLRSGAQADDGLIPYSDMVSVPAGPFEMGCSPNDTACYSQEKPLHMVTLNAYAIDKYEVTNARYAACVARRGCTAPQNTSSYTRSSYYDNRTYANYPVISVDWNQARAFCAWDGKRLPTEAEWEKAARGNSGTPIYPWGDQAAPNCKLTNYQVICVGDTAQVGSYPSGVSPYGALDMAGNVSEWVNDWYDAGYYSVLPVSNPPGPASGDYRVARGGAWNSTWEAFIRTSYRLVGYMPTTGNVDLGLRCARSQ